MIGSLVANARAAAAITTPSGPKDRARAPSRLPRRRAIAPKAKPSLSTWVLNRPVPRTAPSLAQAPQSLRPYGHSRRSAEPRQFRKAMPFQYAFGPRGLPPCGFPPVPQRTAPVDPAAKRGACSPPEATTTTPASDPVDRSYRRQARAPPRAAAGADGPQTLRSAAALLRLEPNRKRRTCCAPLPAVAYKHAAGARVRAEPRGGRTHQHGALGRVSQGSPHQRAPSSSLTGRRTQRPGKLTPRGSAARGQHGDAGCQLQRGGHPALPGVPPQQPREAPGQALPAHSKTPQTPPVSPADAQSSGVHLVRLHRPRGPTGLSPGLGAPHT